MWNAASMERAGIQPLCAEHASQPAASAAWSRAHQAVYKSQSEGIPPAMGRHNQLSRSAWQARRHRDDPWPVGGAWAEDPIAELAWQVLWHGGGRKAANQDAACLALRGWRRGNAER